jgi:hypothetical protein
MKQMSKPIGWLSCVQQSGMKALRRMIVYDLGPDRVRRCLERSTGSGKARGMVYDFI